MLAQKMVGRACGRPEENGNQRGILPDTYCEPKITTLGSQNTTGLTMRDELKNLACLGFSADRVIQSFCYTDDNFISINCRVESRLCNP